MCQVHNPVGSLTVIKTHLHQHNLYEYKSLNELIYFQKNYPVARKQIISNHTLLVDQEKVALNEKITQLDGSIKANKRAAARQMLLKMDKLKVRLNALSSMQPDTNPIGTNYLKKGSLKLRIGIKKIIPGLKLAWSLRPLKRDYNQTNTQYQYINSSFQDAVMQSSRPQLEDIDRKKILIDQINSSIYGAQGEQKVVRELEKLSDDYILINDFTRRFNPPIYNRKEDDHIQSIQIDHLLIAPSGIFIIETKNWSQESLVDPTMFSPVKQVKRTNFALYILLYGNNFNFKRWLYKNQWDHKKIPIRNVVVFIHHKPPRQSDYVKQLTLSELLGYVNYFPPCFLSEETQKIAEYLLTLGRL